MNENFLHNFSKETLMKMRDDLILIIEDEIKDVKHKVIEEVSIELMDTYVNINKVLKEL